jgi:hypothetical protein
VYVEFYVDVDGSMKIISIALTTAHSGMLQLKLINRTVAKNERQLKGVM